MVCTKARISYEYSSYFSSSYTKNLDINVSNSFIAYYFPFIPQFFVRLILIIYFFPSAFIEVSYTQSSKSYFNFESKEVTAQPIQFYTQLYYHPLR